MPQVPPKQNDFVKRAMISLIAGASQAIAKQKTLTVHPFNEFDHRLIILSKLREIIEHLGQASTPEGLRTRLPGVNEDDLRPEVKARAEAATKEALEEREHLKELIANAEKAETDIKRTSETEKEDVETTLKLIDQIKQTLKFPITNITYFDSGIKEIKTQLELLLGPMTDRQAALQRLIENVEAQFLTQYSKYLRPEEKVELSEVRERITQRLRSFLEKRRESYNNCLQLNLKIMPASELNKNQALITNINSILARMEMILKEVLATQMETGRMLRLEKGALDKLLQRIR